MTFRFTGPIKGGNLEMRLALQSRISRDFIPFRPRKKIKARKK